MAKHKLERPKYNLSDHLNALGSIVDLKKNMQFHTVTFKDSRKELHNQFITELTGNVTHTSKPKAILVIGGAGSGKSTVINIIKDTHPFVLINSDELKKKLVEFEYERDKSLSKVHWSDILQKEAVFLRQEMLFQVIRSKYDLILETVGSDIISIQSSIDAIKNAGYEVELHLVETKESLSVDRIQKRNMQSERHVSPSYAQKSNRLAKATFRELSLKNHGRISVHRWSNDACEPQLDDHKDINQCFETLITGEDINNLLKNDKLSHEVVSHLNTLKSLLNLPVDKRNSHVMLMALVTDIAFFPEKYFAKGRELRQLYPLLDKNDFHVYYTSIQMRGLVKSHGCVAIGSPQLKSGVSLSAGGDRERAKIQLPDPFRKKLYDTIVQASIPDELINQLGMKEFILDTLNSDSQKSFYDSHSVEQLIKSCAPDLLDEYRNTILFKSQYNFGFELWTKPRSELQNKDTLSFNQQFPTFLQEQSNSFLSRGWGHLHHALTRKVAIREQKHVACSTVLKRWLDSTAIKSKADESRRLVYNDKNNHWHFDSSALSKQGGNCNTVSTHLLGRNADTASVFNIGSSKWKQIEFPRLAQIKDRGFRETRSGNLYSEMLLESHLAKLIVHNPQPYQDSVLKVNKEIIKQLSEFDGSDTQELVKAINNHFGEYREGDDPFTFLDHKLSSTAPEDIYRGLLFHKVFFETLIKKPVATAIRNRYEYFTMRPSYMFHSLARGGYRNGPMLEHHAGVGGMRLHHIGPLHLHENSLNEKYPSPPAIGNTTFVDLHKRFTDTPMSHSDTYKDRVIEYDALFYSGASGSTTTMMPYVFGTILKDDPSAHEDYILAQAAANSYAGHHSMFEIVAPLKHMKSDCPEQFSTLSEHSDDLYERVLTPRFKHYIQHAAPGPMSLQDQFLESFHSDLKVMNQHLTKHSKAIIKLNPGCDKVEPLNDLSLIIHKKIEELGRNKRKQKKQFLTELNERLTLLNINNLEEIDGLSDFIKTNSNSFDLERFEGLTHFSRFKSSKGHRITETLWVVEQVQQFLNLLHHSISNQPIDDITKNDYESNSKPQLFGG